MRRCSTRWSSACPTSGGANASAVVQPRPGTTPQLDELAEHVRAQLAAYKAPRDVVLVDAIVRSPSGKPDYRWARGVAIAADGPAITP